MSKPKRGPVRDGNAAWIGGRAPMPFYITIVGGEPFRPEIAFWVETAAGIVWHDALAPDPPADVVTAGLTWVCAPVNPAGRT